ncbi:hypothetical protein [uncultured Gammaproteobacteria bacterium]|jgi:hypothetical protein|uniref:hypothetical protein n=1 Tax=thiotrophic endosymbiont of Bathymodiolus puteoserpentis (Logatchev) TaxID=343240 RepID=UPI0010BB796C|nr:hypothetical protein [thiotrophic endosymbiont of Bathymodiolus puteoserpentis (Logatchev)]CAC9485076.1 hypothetical protein [uncultured Gammaproteobacteria bacterium]CAC9488986.1 hypothetical protein [uncultured Gammaproteobacteria bacterium]CAC9498984.1 hypothetical protein [uncultured Gammaproteobacteria bacterium]CAC9627832.1 hypothetical protein [uncultured Gammaproteobacteria bacterium]CAC9633919.1 hypothetical protein [uncultured Gammaproteobacteria bacterium]
MTGIFFRVFFLVSILLIATSCKKNKCIEIVDQNNQVLNGQTHIYLLNLNEVISRQLDTQVHSYKKEGRLIAKSENGKICLSSKDEILFVRNTYKIVNFDFLIELSNNVSYFNNFDLIPLKIMSN